MILPPDPGTSERNLEMITSPQTNEALIQRVRAIRRQPGWTNPLEAVNGRRLLDVRSGRAA